MKTLPLREWTTTPALPLTAAERDLLRIRFAAKVEPTVGADGRYDVTPTNTIGAAIVGDTSIVVKPKIPISRVMFLLGYSADPADWHDDDAAALADVPDLVAAMATLYVRLTTRALRRGRLAGYHPAADELHTIRGRIDLAEQLRRRPGLDLPLAVQWQEYDEDITENQLLLAAARLLKPLPINDTAVRRDLHRFVETMQLVSTVHYPPHHVPEPIWSRLNLHYRPAVELARLLLHHSSIDLAAGGTSTPAITINMARLFEHFVRAALRHALPATEAQLPTGATAPIPFDTRGAVRLEPDLTYRPHGRCTFLGDVKYKRDTGTGHSSDLYQMLAYATASQLPEATLVYAEGPPSSSTLQVRGADTAIHLHLHHLDLTAPSAHLLAQIQTLAAAIRHASSQAGPSHDMSEH